MNDDSTSGGISYQEALAAHAGTSWVPEKRATQEIESHAAELAADYAALERHAPTPEKREVLDAEFARYRAAYSERKRRYLASRSRLVSWAIAGPSNFPARRMEKRGDVAHRRLGELIAFRERDLEAIKRTLHPEWRPIMAGDADAEERLIEKIAEAEAQQEQMKAANAAIRREKKNGQAAQVAALVGLSLPESAARKLLEPDWAGRVGFPDYETRNNGANIRRMRARLDDVRRLRSLPEVTRQGAAARVEDVPAENRVRLFFPGKPALDVRERLKRSGFRWAPSFGAWSAFRNERTLALAAEIAGATDQATQAA